MADVSSFLEFTDADLKAALHRTLKTIAVLAAILFVIVTIAAGWQTGLLLLVGALVSASSVYEWQRLIAAVNTRLDNLKPAQPTGRVIATFVLRLALVAGLLYVSLKCLHGSVYALVAGLTLAVVGLSVEAVRLVRA